MTLSMLDSEKGKLIYQFLLNTEQTLSDQFLNTFEPLDECRIMLRNRKKCSMKVQGFTLEEIINKDSELRSLVSQVSGDKGPVLGNYVNDVKNILSTFVQLRSRKSRVSNVTSKSRIESPTVNAPRLNLKSSTNCNSEHLNVSETNTASYSRPEVSDIGFLFSSASSGCSSSNNSYSAPRRNSNEIPNSCSPTRTGFDNINTTCYNRLEPLNGSPSAEPSSSDVAKINNVTTEPSNTYSAQHSASISAQLNTYTPSPPKSSDVTKIPSPSKSSDVTKIQSPPKSSDITKIPSPSKSSDVTKISSPPKSSDVTKIDDVRLTDVNPTNLIIQPISNLSQTAFTDTTVEQPPASSKNNDLRTDVIIVEPKQSPWKKVNPKNDTLLHNGISEVESTTEEGKRDFSWDSGLRRCLDPEEILTATCTKRKYNVKNIRKTPKKRKANDDTLESIKKATVDDTLSKLPKPLNLNANKKKSEKSKSQPMLTRRATKNNAAVKEDRKSECIQEAEKTKEVCKKKNTEKQRTNTKRKVLAKSITKNKLLDGNKNELPNETKSNDLYNDEKLVLIYDDEVILFNKESVVDSSVLLKL